MGIEVARSELLDDKLQETIAREVDFVQKVITTQGQTLIVHLEFQSTDDQDMLKRMQLYPALLSQKYDLPIRQFVIYIGEQPPKMRTQLKIEETFTGFELINLQTFDTHLLVNARLPEEVVLAVLSDFDTTEAPNILPKIIERLKELSDSEATLKKYTYQLLTLARLRNLSEITQQILDNMAFNYDIKKDAFYQRGKIERENEIVLKMVKAGVPINDISKFTGLTTEQIVKLSSDQ